MAIVSAHGNRLVDHNGNEWLDMQSGILNTPFGHGSAVIDQALMEVIDSGLVNTYDRAGRAQTELIELMGRYTLGYTWKPFNTGAEAIEKAIELAATWIGRSPKIAVLPDSFHGKNLSMAFAHYGHKLPWGNPLNIVVTDPTIDEAIPDFDVLIYEPVQGHNGRVNDEDLLRKLCDVRGAFLIADEMITGFMRCGKRFMSKEADMIVTGKGISAGVPLSLLGFRHDLDEPIPVGWRTTGAGNNLSMTVALTSLQLLIDEEKSIKKTVYEIETQLVNMGFHATGALGFKPLHIQEAARAYFEDRRIIASWHNPPQMRVGPSFVTSDEDFENLESALKGTGEL